MRPDSQSPGSYEIIAGERRWRAAQIAKLHELPIVVHELSDSEALEVGLVENIQRTDLTPTHVPSLSLLRQASKRQVLRYKS